MPWWRAALGPDELKELDGAKRLANERFVAKDLKAALRGYDSVVGAIGRALSAPHVGPCAATQQLFATCLANRAACRSKLGDVESLQNAEDDCVEALEGPYTGWLRARLEPAASKLFDVVTKRRQHASDLLHSLLRASAHHNDAATSTLLSDAANLSWSSRPTEAFKASAYGGNAVADGHVWLFGDHDRDLFLKLAFEGDGWDGLEVGDIAPVVALSQFAVVAPSGLNFLKLSRSAVRTRVTNGECLKHRVAIAEDAPKRTTVDVTLDARAYRDMAQGVDDTCATMALMRVDAARGKGAADRHTCEMGDEPPTDECPICGADTAERLRRGLSVSRGCGNHPLCGDCARHWLAVLRDAGRRPVCPVSRDPWADKRERDSAAPLLARTSLSLVVT